MYYENYTVNILLVIYLFHFHFQEIHLMTQNFFFNFFYLIYRK